MNINSISGLTGISELPVTKVSGTKAADQLNSIIKTGADEESKTTPFDSLLKSAMDMISETNQYTNEAAEAELAYAMGINTSTHDLQVAQMKANISLQYTVAVRNAVMDAYKEIMSLQF